MISCSELSDSCGSASENSPSGAGSAKTLSTLFTPRSTFIEINLRTANFNFIMMIVTYCRVVRTSSDFTLGSDTRLGPDVALGSRGGIALQLLH